MQPDTTSKATNASNISAPETDRGVLLSACELFVSRTHHAPEDTRVFTELALNLLPKTKLSDRRRISSLLARHKQSPLPLLEMLALDADPLTAYSVLRFADDISMKILEEIIVRGPDSLRQAIGERPVLTVEIVEGICRHGGENVVQRLLARPGISRFIKKPKPVVKPGDDGKVYVENITRETKQTPDKLMTDFFSLDKKLRGKAIAAAEMSAIVGQTNGDLASVPSVPRDEDLVEIILTTVLSENPFNAVKVLGQTMQLAPETITQIIDEDNGDSLAIVLISQGFTEEEATTIIIRTLGQRRGLLQLRPVFTLFRNISLSASQILVGHWSVERKKPAAQPAKGHQPIHTDAEKKISLSETPAATEAASAAQKPFGRRAGFTGS